MTRITVRMYGMGKVFALKGNIGSYTEEDISALAHEFVEWIDHPSNRESKNGAISKSKNGFLKIGSTRLSLVIAEDKTLMHAEVVRCLKKFQGILRESSFSFRCIAG